MIYLLSLILSLFMSVEAQARDLYVNNTGSVVCSNSTDINSVTASSPWCDMIRAVRGNMTHSTPDASQAAAAGDIVHVTAGTYNTSSGPASSQLTGVILNPVNDGTLGSPIIFQAVGHVVLTHTAAGNPLIGTSGKDHIWWKGDFYINEASAATVPDTGAVVFFDTTGGGADGIEVDGNGGTVADNHTGIRVQTCTGVTIRNTRLHNFTNTVVNPINAAGVEVYNCYGMLMEHNEIYDAGSGIFYKAIGFQGSTIDPARFASLEDVVRYNYIHDVQHGIVIHRVFHTSSTVYILVYQNIVRTTFGSGDTCLSPRGFPAQTAQGYTVDGPSNARFVNNTCYNAEVGGLIGANAELYPTTNNLMQNNLYASVVYGLYSDDDAPASSYDTTALLLKRNWYYSYTTFERYVSSHTFAEFQSTYSGQEVDSVAGTDPQFVNAGANDFHLQVGSPARTAGRAIHGIGGADGTTIPVGAYITGNETIGIESTAVSVGLSGGVRFSGGVRLQ